MGNNKIILDMIARDETKRAFDEATSSIDKMTQAGEESARSAVQNSQKQRLSLTDLKSGIDLVGDAIGSLKKVWDFAKEGAQIELTKMQFGRLTDEMGGSSAMLDRLRAATKGTASDMELIGSATDFMKLGLAKTSDEVVRLTRVAGALNMDMNQLVLTLANQTTMRFDQLGVSVDGFDEKVKALKATGMDANTAFKEAFLQQAEDQIRRVGDAADTTAGKMKKFEANIKNAGDKVKEFFAQGVSTGIDILNAGDNALTAYSASAAVMRGEVLAGRMTLEDYNIALDNMGNSISGIVAPAIIAQTRDTLALTDAQIAATQVIRNLTTVTVTETAETTNLNGGLMALYTATRDATNANLDYQAGTDSLILSTQALNKETLFKIATEGLDAEAALAVARSMGMVDEQTVVAIEKQRALKKQYDDGIISLSEYIRKTNELGVSINLLPDKKIITVEVRTQAGGQNGVAGGAIGDDVPPGGRGYARGGSFVVPSGYPNDTYPMRVSSGERVIVIPNKGGNTNNMTMNVYAQSAPNVINEFALMRAMVGA